MARVGEEFPFACPGCGGERRMQPGQSRLLLLMIRPTRQTLAEAPLADLTFNHRHLQQTLSAKDQKGRIKSAP
jgi:hypothetical protein